MSILDFFKGMSVKKEKKPPIPMADPKQTTEDYQLAHLQLCLSNDFGKPFRIDGYRSDVTKEQWKELTEGSAEELPWHNGNIHVSRYTGGSYPEVVCFSRDVPTFDSSDRVYDSWHNLYLICDHEGPVSGVYVTGGYEIAKLCGFDTLLDCPEEMKKLLD